MVASFWFPLTPIGLFAYSDKVCDDGTSNAGKPIASARCTNRTGRPRFEEPQILDCGQTLTDIQQNLTNSANIEALASNTQILTSVPQELTPDNITTAAQIVQTLLVSSNVTENVRLAAIATVSQLLSANETDDTKQNNATLGLTVTLDNLSVSLSLSLNTSASQVVQPNLVVQSAQIPAVNTQGVQFTSFSGTAGTFSANRIELNVNTTSVVVNEGSIPEALIFVRFPKEEAAVERATPSNVSLGFVLYQNDRFFRSRRYKRQRATIRVLSGTVQGPLVPQHLEMMFRPQMINGTSLYEFACVFWNYELNDWSTDGCSKGNTSDGFLRCFCNHTTNFAALWSFRENYEYAQALDWISTIGLCLSIAGLVVTIVHHLEYNFCKFSGDSKGSVKARVVLLCIYITLLAFIITFLSGVRNYSRQYEISTVPDRETNTVLLSEEYVEPDTGPCTAVTALLHFFLLASFLWNCVYGTQLVLLLRSLHSSLPPYWTKLSHAVGWGIPAVVTAITLAITYRADDPLGYRQEEFCWLAALDKAKRFDYRKPMFWGFLLPVGLILIYNIVLLVLTSMTTCKTNKNLQSTKHLSLRKKVLISFSVAVLLGLSWILGYLVLVTSGQPHLVFSVIFCICTTTQGFQIFILFTARTPSFRKNVSLSLQRLTEVNNELHGRTYHLWKNLKSMSTSETYRDLEDHYSKSLRR
ncbi:Adhesion G-protein coupled receptor G7 [Takifugu flavidus]|uniref:Adhesion G-protein coupled receptor G7 n=2 Tax=Takifugu flavidus TaxID=433684 RepID=A0A5C6ND58_9TELE|nr:Adhesion G-protein coupled receptor G7 [Takifugu flavidus]